MAWLSVTHISFIFLLIWLKDSSGQQNGLVNQANTNTPLGPPHSQISQNSLNQLSKCPVHQKLLNGQLGGNLQLPANLQQQLSLQQAALQQQYNLQQAANLQHAANLQQAANFQQANLPQMTAPGNLNQLNIQQPGNLQQLNLQPQEALTQLQPNMQLSMQPNNFQQNVSPNLANLQLVNNNCPDIGLTSAPVINPQFSGASPQIPQQFPDISLTSPIAPSISYSFNPVAQPTPTVNPTNQQIPFINVPPGIDLSQVAKPSASFTPVSEFSNINNQQFALVALPIQNQRSVNSVQTNNPNPTSGVPNQVTIIKSVQPQGYFDPIQTSIDADQNKLSLISSLISDSPPNQMSSSSLLNSNSILGAALSKTGSKSSNLQALLPLLFNLLKEKNSGCACHHCGCMNNKQEPQIFTGYANQHNYGQEVSSGSLKNNVLEETTESSNSKILEAKKKSIKENTINNTNSSENESDNDYSDDYEDDE